MRKLLSTLFLVLFVVAATAQTSPADSTQQSKEVSHKLALTGRESPGELIEMAAVSYSNGRYNDAVNLYETILKNHGISYKIYYNLGNAYYKCDRLAPAILNFERALRLNPSDADARFNLEMCQARIVDKIDPIGMFLIARWYHSLGNLFDSNGWAFVSIFFYILFVGCLFSYFFARRRWLKKLGFFAGVVLLSMSSLSLIYSAQASHRLTNPDEAILFTPSVTVKSSPDKSGTDLFVIHEGCKMKIRSTLGHWSEIELEDGNVGWLLSKEIQII
ncbi:MAG TPA: tetratricopeptide repeat protein [Bacteroidales bacterium]|nr:tetratricopeptide repeat protein [Bacteroidales bacterium]